MVPAASSMVTAKDLQQAVSDLQTTAPGPGLVKTAVCALLTLPLLYLALTTDDYAMTTVYAALTGIAYSAWIITTHDAIHHTLTGWAWFDEGISHLISWPLLWLHGTYSEVHKVHHKMNGDDLADPERVQWTEAEYAEASAVGRLYVKYQWFFDLFVFAGIGMIYKTVGGGWRFASRSKAMRRALMTDFTGIVVCTSIIYTVAGRYGMALHTFYVWLILQWFAGLVIQWRAHVEHYGLWGKGRHYFETQAYNCRNLRTNGLTSWFFNRLNFHSVHHAFPRVPFYLLGTAHQRFMALYQERAPEPLVEEQGYVATSVRLARNPMVIGGVDPDSPSHRRQMVRV